LPVKKSEIYSSIWESCDELRGGMDASQYKDYVLVLLFMKYVSDRFAGKKDALIEVPAGASFADMVALKGKKEIGDGINKIIEKLAEANDLKGIIDVADFNDESKLGEGKEMQDRLSALIAIFQKPELDFSRNRADGDDLLGDAYEYLMRHFATESGKSKGQFYTPAEVSRIMAKVIGINKAKRQDQTVYDPTCGSGSLLLKAAAETECGITIYGQEMDVATRGLAKMNMILHGNPTAEIYQGNTLAKPLLKNPDGTLKTFDFAVANPPFSSKAWSNGFDPYHDEYGRFEGIGVPPAKNGDYAFLLHLIKSLKSTGKGAIILPHGVLFRGNSEAEIRKNLITRGYIKGIIGLPPNLFYGTGIPACIVVIDKEDAASRTAIFMIDASKGYIKDGNKNRLREQDIHKIVDVFNNQIEVPKFSRLVPVSEIGDPKNDYNLNIPRYIDSQEEEDLQDIEAHLLGGIPARDIENLADYWTTCPSLKSELFAPNRPGYYTLKVEKEKIKATILANAQFLEYSRKVEGAFEGWKKEVEPLLYNLQIGSKPKELITTLSEKLLAAFENDSLIDKYDVYQKLMDYWTETMHDDTYLISTEGWQAEPITVKNAKGKEVGWTCDLLPKQVVISKYFAKEQENIDNLKAQAEELEQQMGALVEENSGEDDLFAEVKNDADKISKPLIAKRLKEIKGENDYAEEAKVLQQYLELTEKQNVINGIIKEAETDLDKKLLIKYKGLAEAEIKSLVVETKWLKTIQDAVRSEIKKTWFELVNRIKSLTERYELSLPQMMKAVSDFSTKVDNHLKNMGFNW
jgi:type I restriction enzyme M protein